MSSILKSVTYIVCNLTGLTNVVARFSGVGYFLPHLFRLRYANFGDIEPEIMSQKINSCNSFEESVWCPHWNTAAEAHEKSAREALSRKDVPAAWAEARKAIAYYSASAFPGTTPKRLKAHAKAKALFEEMLAYWGDEWEKVVLPIEGEQVTGYLRLPNRIERHPVVLMTNGLEGTSPELCVSILSGHQDMGEIALFAMEMPGTYEYKKPLSVQSALIYNGVVDYLVEHKNIDEDKIGMAGISFGAHWSARMAAKEPRLKASIVNGAPLLFDKPGARPVVINDAMKKVTGTTSIGSLIKALKSLSFNNDDGKLFDQIKIPLLVINGDKDTLIPTSDSIELAHRVKGAKLKLYENDDHCAMGHYREMTNDCMVWMKNILIEDV